MAPIISAQGLSKRYGTAPLFQNISFTVSEGDRIGLIGPNGSGKSTLLAILDGRVKPDAGDVAVRKGTRLSCVAQVAEFASGATIRSVIDAALDRISAPHEDRAATVAETLGRAGFTDFDIRTDTLSGGWRKRLAIAEALVQQPDILLLDEPTNHLDIAGIEWVETLLRSASFACVVVSHDRYFLENVSNEMVELSRAYSDGFLRVSGNYSKFLESKAQYLHAQQKRQDALENRVRTEIEWLRRGPKARTTKSKSRIDQAHAMIGELADLNSRTRLAAANIDFSASGRQTKQLVQMEGVSYAIGGRALFEDIQFTLTAGMRVGLVGPNGSGKTTLLRLLRGDLEVSAGQIRKADGLRIVYFDQNRALDPDVTLRRALAPDSDSVIYQERVIHVAAWAARFLFAGEDLNRPVGRLSGGERARVLIAQLMLQPADLLLLDEPTNDLDIATLEILEESLLEFGGALVLVTHDRYMLDRVSTVVLGLDGLGGFGRFASYSQWDAWQSDRLQARAAAAKSARLRGSAGPRTDTAAGAPAVTGANVSAGPSAAIASNATLASNAAAPKAAAKKKLSFSEVREFETIEARIAEAERELEAQVSALNDPAVTGAPALLRATSLRIDELQQTIDNLYARWAELEQKQP